MQKIVFCDTIVRGGTHHFTMPKPQHYGDYYEDLATYAISVGDFNEEVFAYRGADLKTFYSIKEPSATTYSSEVTINDKGVYCADKPCWIQYEFKKPTLVYNVVIEPSGTNIQCQRLNVKASDDGVNFLFGDARNDVLLNGLNFLRGHRGIKLLLPRPLSIAAAKVASHESSFSSSRRY